MPSSSRTAIFWATQVTSISFEIAFLVLIGYWGDRYWGTTPLLLLVGSGLGLLVLFWHLWLMVKSFHRTDSKL
ncbi:AtpZ/AtpI family protein [Planctomicrobium sp. SH668]|uniref:AtpZ/AtpI family protein n=1 Tax=Planctomicrobium sp. SH668 TaxID=3448126 RepID=UPI003F5BFD0A